MKLAQFGDQVVNAGDRFGWIGSALQLQQKSRGEAGSAEEGLLVALVPFEIFYVLGELLVEGLKRRTRIAVMG